MKKMMKKMMAFILIVAMCAGMWSLPEIVNADAPEGMTTTGALTILNAGTDKIFFNTTNELPLNYGDYVYDVAGSGGMLHNGVAFDTDLVCTGTNILRWDLPKSTVDLQVGDQLEIFGQFAISGGTPFWIVPTVIECTAMTEAGVPSWTLVSSAEEEETTTVEEEYLTLSNFGGHDSFTSNTVLTLDTDKTINGKTFRTFLSYDKSDSDTYGTPHIYYGCSSDGGWDGIRVTVTHIADDKNLITVTQCYSTQKELGRMFMTDSELAAENLLQIKFPVADDSDSGSLTVSINDSVIVDSATISPVSYHKGYIHLLGGTGYTRSLKTYTELRWAEYKMERAEEITVADFGIADGLYDSTQSGDLGCSLDGKKMVFTFERGNLSSEARAYYGGSSWFRLRTDGNDVLHYYRNGTTYISQNASNWTSTELKPVKMEIYMEYVDLDDDGLKDDARMFVRRDGSQFSTIFDSSYYDEEQIWMEDIDALYVINDTFQLTTTGQAAIKSVNTHAAATLEDGILTISGEGKVVPSVLEGVVTDATVVKAIQIEDGMEAVCAGVFNGYTALETVTYADTVTSVSDTAFSNCATRVKVVSPEGYAFDGGLVDAIHVSSFKFTELDIDRSEKTEAGLTIELKTSTVIKGTAEEGNLTATTYSGLQAEIGGTSVAVTFRKTSYGTLACDIPMESLSSADAYTIVFKSGVMEDNDDAQTICLGLKEDFTVYVNAAGLSGTGYVTDHGAVTLQVRAAGASQTQLYLVVNGTADGMPSVSETGGYVYLEPVGEHSGIFLNGKKISATFGKAASNTYYLHLGGASYAYTAGKELVERNGQAGDYVTLYGQFRYQDHIVEIEPSTIHSLGGSGEEAWEDITPTDNTITYGEEIIDLDTTGIGYTVLEGLADAVISTGEESNTYTDNTALYLPGDYTVTRTIDGVDYVNPVILYHQGDVNTDDVLNVQDLVAMKKYQKDATAYGKAAVQAATSVGEDAETQMQAVRKMLVATTVSKDGTELPMELVGQQLGKGEIAWADSSEAETYITSVNVTDNGTTVFGMQDGANNGYNSSPEQMAAFDDYGYDYIIDLNATRDFKILQLTDTQIIERENGRDIIVDGEVTGNRKASTPQYETRGYMEELMAGYMDQVVKDTAPDLILLTGDNIMGEFDDEGSELQNLINKMDSYGILWAPIFGNHDNESLIGVTAQCQMFNDSKYCLFNRRHEVGGNGNYTIGLAQNGEIQRSVIMMDSNYTGLAVSENLGHYREYPELDQLNNCTTEGFTYVQNEWYRDIATRINTVAERTVPSFLVYHIPTKDVYYAELAAGYITENDNANYTITEENRAQPGDSGVKTASNAGCYTNATLLGYMNEVGTDGAFFGHLHRNSTSIFYGGVRWTFGVKTGCYDFHSANEVGGTLITLSADDYISFAITPKTYDCPTQADDGFECSRH